MNCTDNQLTTESLISALVGINVGNPSLRLKQVASVGNYFNCTSEIPADYDFILRGLMDLNACNQPCLRVDIVADDAACTPFITCLNNSLSNLEILKSAIGRGADGLPTLRIMLS